MKYVVIGSINIDYILDLENYPKPGETILSKKMQYKYGGKGANQAYYLSKFHNTVLLSKIGKDSGLEYVKYLENNNVNTNYIEATDSLTGNAFIMNDKNGESMIIVVSNSNSLIDIEYIKKNDGVIKNTDYIIIQNEIPKETIEYILKEYKDKNILYNFSPILDIDFSLLTNVEYLVVNQNEYEYIKSKTNIKPKKILLTKGRKGASILANDYMLNVSAKKVENVVDSTGAGDSFLGSFSANLHLGEQKALEIATEVAAKVITKKGAQI